MALPGKLFIALLEEDDPQKSYFRLKPLLVEENGIYQPFTNAEDLPEHGCIRIVPDRNEAIHFKARMREIGCFVQVDLRSHPYVNNKIRPNKNYRPGEAEQNAYIIYSDVVHAPAPDTVFALIDMHPEDAENAPMQDIPPSRYLLLDPESAVQPQIWTYELDPREDCVRLQRREGSVAADELQLFELPVSAERTARFAVRKPGTLDPAPQQSPAAGQAPAAQPAPASPEKAAAPAPVVTSPEPAADPAPVSEEPKAPAPDPRPAPRTRPAEKPWIQHSNAFAPPRIDPSMSPRQQALAMQCGLNPRRGRSLKEIIDESWRVSRMDQLGTPSRELTNAMPAQNSSAAAVSLVRQCWEDPACREALVRAIADTDGLEEALDARRAALKESAVNAQLTELEAQRLEMLAALDELKKLSRDTRNTLKQEIRRDDADTFRESTERAERARAEQQRLISENETLKAQAESAKDAIAALTDGRFEERLNEYLVNRHAADLLEVLDRKPVRPFAQTESGIASTAEEMIGAVRECFASAGRPIDLTSAIGLLICLAQSPYILLSGAPGSGKTRSVRLLARALGISEKRLLEYAPGKSSLEDREELAPLAESDLPAVVLLDDLNLADADDPSRGLNRRAESGELTLVATVQDDGVPLPAFLLDRAFTMRLPDEGSASVWAPPAVSEPKRYPVVTRRALRQAFAPTSDPMPQSLLKRMEKLRADMGMLGIRVSRRALTAVWNYCSAALPLMPIEPTAVLDLAVSQRILPAVLASAPVPALRQLPRLLEDMPRCRSLLNQPLPIEI